MKQLLEVESKLTVKSQPFLGQSSPDFGICIGMAQFVIKISCFPFVNILLRLE